MHGVLSSCFGKQCKLTALTSHPAAQYHSSTIAEDICISLCLCIVAGTSRSGPTDLETAGNDSVWPGRLSASKAVCTAGACMQAGQSANRPEDGSYVAGVMSQQQSLITWQHHALRKRCHQCNLSCEDAHDPCAFL